MSSIDTPEPPSRNAGWVVTGAIAAFALVGAVQSRRDVWVVLAGVALAVGGAALFATPRRPVLVPVFAVVSAGGVALLGTGEASNVGWFAVCVLVGWSAFLTSTRVVIGLWAAGIAMFGLQWGRTTHDPGWAAWIAGTTFAAVGFLLARRERDLAERLRIAQTGLSERVRAEERNRIARELHDVIAHSLTVSLLHVSSARLSIEEDPAGAGAALAEAERLGRECLTEVRHVVGLLRHDEGRGTAPLPGAAQLATLVEQYRRAGADVALDVTGEPAELSATVGLAVYRILQEALANAARHAPGTRTRAGLSVTPTGVTLVVDSDGPPGVGTGSGLLSMRERAEILGGGCTAGPTAEGWRVRAELPRQPVASPAALR